MEDSDLEVPADGSPSSLGGGVLDASGVPPPDGDQGSFSEDPPWLVEPASFLWLRGLDRLRRGTREEVPFLLRRRRLPPGRRVLKALGIFGRAIACWYLRDRKGSRSESRRGMSRRLRLAFHDLGPTYIKLGQILSAGEGLFPEEVVSEFRLLRDHVPAEDFETVRETIEADLGCRLEDVFAELSTEPLAAASIAQVHAGVLLGGEPVVVKVQRSKVARLVSEDLSVMSWLAPALVGRIPVAALVNPPALVEVFAETVVEELDFRLEAGNMLDLARVLGELGQDQIIVARPHPRLVTKRVLVMERIDGFSWADAEGMRSRGIDTAAVLRASTRAFVEGLMFHGMFHGDLHAGNLIVRPDGRVALLDFGIMGRLDERGRLAFVRLLLGVAMGDVSFQVEALQALGALPCDIDEEALVRDFGLDAPPRDPLAMSAQELSAEVREMTKKLLGYGARMPKELILFVKDMLFIDGAVAVMAPDVDLFAEITMLVMYLTGRHGDRLSREIGLDPSKAKVDLNMLRSSMGLDEGVQSLSYNQLRERREIILKRLDARQGRRSR